ncbi:MAG: iron-sulfur cluster assembly scaffold protein [Desulfobacterium sp.]|jgi:nitrogen fixation NifU-like protein|nr:iron-sulfur cluster assembly scaffold protein [Desulfobacterium sp.]
MEQQTIKNFWQDHSLEYLEMAFRTDFQERVEHPDGHGKKTGECGDTVEFFLMAKNGVLTSVTYDVDGCRNTNACANTVVSLAQGKSVNEAWNITHEEVSAFLKTLPANETHCAELAMGAFYLALRDLAEKSKHVTEKENAAHGQDIIV